MSFPYDIFASQKSPTSQGCLIGYNAEGLRCISLATGEIRSLKREMQPIRQYQFYAPAIDWNTSTIYYIDAEREALMRWRVNEPHPEVLLKVPVSPPHFFPELEWLILTPDGRTLFFIIPESGTLMEYNLSTAQSRKISENCSPRLRPSWFDQSTLLIYGTEMVNIQTGEKRILFENASTCILSESHTRLLISDNVPGSNAYHLYDFPGLQWLKTIPRETFKGTVKGFCFVNEYQLAIGRTLWGTYEIPGGTYLFDLQTEQWKKISKYSLHGMYYSSTCPEWIEW